MGCANSHTSAVGANSHTSAPAIAFEEVGAKDSHDIYLLGVELGRGVYGRVRVCTKKPAQGNGNPKERAVKILPISDNSGKENPRLLEAAREESTAWKTVGDHPSCIRLHDVFFSNGSCYMVTEKCSGTLLQGLKGMPELTERSLGNVFAQMLLGISHCHSVEVVHGDIKPDNFLVGGENGRAIIKLIDFGESVLLPKKGKLPAKIPVGTPPFMCPEMLVELCYDEKADVWSFGVIVYVLMLGVWPYMPKPPLTSSATTMKRAIVENVDPPSFKPVDEGLGPAALERSEEYVSMMKTLLDREPERRPSAEKALHMLNNVMLSTDMIAKGLPCLRPMLQSARKIGAFQRDDQGGAILNIIKIDNLCEPSSPTHHPPYGSSGSSSRSTTSGTLSHSTVGTIETNV